MAALVEVAHLETTRRALLDFSPFGGEVILGFDVAGGVVCVISGTFTCGSMADASERDSTPTAHTKPLSCFIIFLKIVAAKPDTLRWLGG